MNNVSIAMSELQALNESAKALNDKRLRDLGAKNAASEAYNEKVKQYATKYGVTLDDSNLKQEFDSVTADIVNQATTLKETVDYINSGEYLKENNNSGGVIATGEVLTAEVPETNVSPNTVDNAKTVDGGGNGGVGGAQLGFATVPQKPAEVSAENSVGGNAGGNAEPAPVKPAIPEVEPATSKAIGGMFNGFSLPTAKPAEKSAMSGFEPEKQEEPEDLADVADMPIAPVAWGAPSVAKSGTPDEKAPLSSFFGGTPFNVGG